MSKLRKFKSAAAVMLSLAMLSSVADRANAAVLASSCDVEFPVGNAAFVLTTQANYSYEHVGGSQGGLGSVRINHLDVIFGTGTAGLTDKNKVWIDGDTFLIGGITGGVVVNAFTRRFFDLKGNGRLNRLGINYQENHGPLLEGALQWSADYALLPEGYRWHRSCHMVYRIDRSGARVVR